MLETRAGTDMRVPAFSRRALCEKAPFLPAAEPSARKRGQDLSREEDRAQRPGGWEGTDQGSQEEVFLQSPIVLGGVFPRKRKKKKKKNQGGAKHMKIE